MSDQSLENQLKQIAEWLVASRSAIAFTGAGISTESGIPDFRSPGGVWSKNRTVYYHEFLESEADRYEYWRQKSQTHVEFEAASPNAAHHALADWEAAGHLAAVITQNIDGLHAEAGSKKILELHGTARDVVCLSCEKRWPAHPWVQRFVNDDRVPDCPECSGLLKHATVSFGQALPESVFQESVSLARAADLCFACGSSLVVHPAAGIPEMTKRNGGKLVIINRTETPLDSLADHIIREPLGSTLSRIHDFFTELRD